MPAIQQVIMTLRGAAPPPPPVTWQNIVGATESPPGVLTKTAADGWGNCGAVSVVTMAADCRFTYYWDGVEHPFCGIGVDSTCNTFATVDYAFNPIPNTDSVQVWENGGQPGVTPPSHGPGQFQMVQIERIGSVVKYYSLPYSSSGPRPATNDPSRILVYTSLVSSTGTLYVNVAMFNNGSTADAANFVWEAI